MSRCDECLVDHYLRECTTSQRKLLVSLAGDETDDWHPLLRDLIRCAAADVLRIRDEEQAAFERLVRERTD